MIAPWIASALKASHAARRQRLLDCLRRLRRERRAVVALEFALLAIPAVTLLFGVMVVAADLYFQEVLDYSTQAAAREVQIGSVASGTTAASFISNNFCPILSSFTPCVNVTIDMQAVTDYYNQNKPIAPAQANSCFNTGSPGQLMYVKVYYLLPTFLAIPFGAGSTTVNGVTGSYIISNAAFENENPTGQAVAAPSRTGC
jgi:Flp pilus assembly protein TadG